MNYKTLKLLSNIVLTLLIVTCSCTVIGFVRHKNSIEPNSTIENNTLEESIEFRYFLEEEQVNELPQNEKIVNKKTGIEEVNILYKYDGIKCSEGVKAIFNEQEWKVEVQEDGKGTCDLTFYKAKYDVSFVVINGVEDKENPKTVERYKDGEFIITPNDGFEYTESQCSNNKIGSYDDSNKIFKLSAVDSDIACKVTFGQKKLKVELTVKNGNLLDGKNGVSTSEVYFGESVTQIVEPLEGFEYTKGHLVCEEYNPYETKKKKSSKKSKTPKVEIEAKYESNNFSITKVTTNTKCTLTFTKQKDVKKYKIKITNSEDYSDTFTITKGSDIVEVESGKTGVIKIKSLIEGTAPKLSCDVRPSNPEPQPINSEYEFKWLNVSQNINCKISK